VNAHFGHPEWLWLLPIAMAWILWWTWRSEVQISPRRRRIVCSIRMVIVAAMVFAVAEFKWWTPLERMTVFFVLDRSDSVPEHQQEAALEWINRLTGEKPPDDRAGVVVFGAEASIETSADATMDLRRIDAVVPTGQTDIGAAIRLAAAAFPAYGQRRMVLLSDGNENMGDALGAAVAAHHLGMNVHVVPLAGETKNDVSIQRMQVPTQLKRGQAFEARIFVHADQAGPAKVQLFCNEQFLGEQTVQLEAGKNLFTFPQSLNESGFYSYDVRLDAPGDAIPENNRAFAFTQVRGLPRVLIVSGDPAADAPLHAAFESPELQVTLTEVRGFPGSLAELQSYDALVLCNVPAGDLSREQQHRLLSAVRDFGMGFVCIGGDQSYAAGAYRGTPIAEVLPVEVELSSRKVLPPGALVLVIDKSGSMAGEKLEMARQGAMAAVQALAASDFVGIIAFDGAPYLVADIQPVGDRGEILRSLAGIRAGGGTSMYPPMNLAWKMLAGVRASYKHCLVLTDGQSTMGDFLGVTQAMVEDRVTVSTVGVGPDADAALLSTIARTGYGRFYAVSHPAGLPQVFIKETAVVLKSAISEEPFMPRLVASTEPVRGLGEFPRLLGHVVTESRARAETPLLTESGDPLLAHWQFGLGRSAAFTSDARSRWAKDWIGWNQYRRFWQQIVRWTLRRVDDADLAIELASERGTGRIVVEALDENGDYLNFLDLDAVVVAPGGTRETVALQQSGPGRYEAAFPLGERGAYLVNLLRKEGGQVRATQAAGISLSSSPEFEASGANLHLLGRIAEVTGGKVLDPSLPAANPFYDDRHKTWEPHDLWETLLQLALVLFVLDVGIRRLHPDPEQLQRFWQAVVGIGLVLRRTPATASASESLSALLARRDEVRAQEAATRVRMEQAPGVTAVPRTPQPQHETRSGTWPEVPNPAAEGSGEPSRSPSDPTSRLLEAKRRAQRKRSQSNR
jgi:Ca-activated chloride channel homolog